MATHVDYTRVHNAHADQDAADNSRVDNSVAGQSSKTTKRCILFASLAMFVAIVITVAVVRSRSHHDQPPSPVVDCEVFCQGPILTAIQLSGLFNSSKVFVDMPMRSDPEVIKDRFQSLPNHEPETLQQFLNANFDAAGSDVEKWTPPDWSATPVRALRVASAELRRFFYGVNDVWNVLGRKPSADVYAHPDRHSLIPTRHNMIVPGGRFREVYYWDSYWIVRGLLVSGMLTTARQLTENLIEFVNEFGFVPNGNRRYYLDRSQPPYLTSMVNEVFQATQNMTYLREAVIALDKEYEYWTIPGRHLLVDTFGTSTELHVNRFYADVSHPRPESFVEDIHTASFAQGDAAKQAVYSNLAAGAETGWDYSSRWFADRRTIETITALHIIPVDLNSLMCRNELLLSDFHTRLQNHKLAANYAQRAQARQNAIHELLWSEEHQQWLDYNFQTKSHGPTGVASNFLPLWSGCYPNSVDEKKVMKALQQSGLDLVGGLSTTNSSYSTGQQWDFPNAWAPIQHMIIEGLNRTSLPEAQDMAFSLAKRWINTTYLAWNATDHLFEKYNSLEPGFTGSGGEYKPQFGFGWTNGVVLAVLDAYGDRLTL